MRDYIDDDLAGHEIKNRFVGRYPASRLCCADVRYRRFGAARDFDQGHKLFYLRKIEPLFRLQLDVSAGDERKFAAGISVDEMPYRTDRVARPAEIFFNLGDGYFRPEILEGEQAHRKAVLERGQMFAEGVDKTRDDPYFIDQIFGKEPLTDCHVPDVRRIERPPEDPDSLCHLHPLSKPFIDEAPMKLNRVVVIYKKPSAVRGAASHKLHHMEAVNRIEQILAEAGISYKIVLRDRLEAMLPSHSPRADLIITIGGDGTVLSASHYAGHTPILGINSSPKTSVGFFCATNVANFRKILLRLTRGLLRPKLLPLLDVSVSGKKLPFRALNDILFASSSPAETVQYSLQVGKRKERQRGSGVWIAAGPGSTAGICSAGGKVTDVSSKKIQYLARELYPIPGVRYRLKKGFVPEKKSIRIRSEMSHGVAFIDGAKLVYPMKRGDTLAARISKRKLKIFL